MADNNQPPKPAEKSKARILVDVTIGEKAYKPNDVGTFDAATIKAHAGALDANPAAVKYAEGLKRGAERDAIED